MKIKGDHDDANNDGFATLCQGFQLFWDEDTQDPSQPTLLKLQSMVGLEEVKALFLITKEMVNTMKKQRIDPMKERFNVKFIGNPGTGKSTIKELYAEFLSRLGACNQQEYDDRSPSSSKSTPKAKYCKTLTLPDYSNDELLEILVRRIHDTYKRKMKVEGGIGGLYCRILVRRVGRGRESKSFRNIWALEDAFAALRYRQAERLYRERLAGKSLDYLLFTKEDLIGCEPSDAIRQSGAWKDLQSMIGLNEVKDSVQALLDIVINNYQRELREEKSVQVTLNRLFLGPPGTGKTTVGKLYGRILADLGLLSSGEVITKNPSDFIGPYVGHSEKKTNDILEAAKGKVLIIDDAYMLYPGSQSGSHNKTDVFRVAVIDTLVAEIENVPGKDMCVILLGYYDQMEEMFRSSNPGLARRFPFEEAFHFTDFDDDQLSKILDLKLKMQDLGATPKAKQVALEILSRARDRPNFGNGGAIENLLSQAKIAYRKRVSNTADISGRMEGIVFEPEDFDANYDRALRTNENCYLLFNNCVGYEDIVSQFEGYQQTVAGMRLHGVDPRPYIPFAFVFKGPPGTGKTTTARKVGHIFYDMGFLSHPEVVECSVSDLVAEYAGQTGPKVIKLLESALGKVLFIDEAYRLGQERFASVAVGELVDCMTKERFAHKIVIVLAGYGEDMSKLMLVNQGLRSRFATEVIFRPMRPEQCMQLLRQSISKLGIQIDGADPEDIMTGPILNMFAKLTGMKSWANGRDVEALGHKVIAHVFKARGREPDATVHLSISANDLLAFLEKKAEELETAEAEMRVSSPC